MKRKNHGNIISETSGFCQGFSPHSQGTSQAQCVSFMHKINTSNFPRMTQTHHFQLLEKIRKPQNSFLPLPTSRLPLADSGVVKAKLSRQSRLRMKGCLYIGSAEYCKSRGKVFHTQQNRNQNYSEQFSFPSTISTAPMHTWATLE